MAILSELIREKRSRATRGEVQLAFGETAEGRICHINEVAAGLACRCFCPGCQRPLIAHKGAVNAHHFRHADHLTCAHGIETVLHRWAKQELDSRGHIQLPEMRAMANRSSRLIRPARLFAYDRIALEYRLANIVPDIVLAGGSESLIVEIAVTHRCEKAKLDALRELRLGAMEIDLSGYGAMIDPSRVKNLVLGGANRYWLFHPLLEAAMHELHSEEATEVAIKQAQRERERAVESKRQRDLRRLDDEHLRSVVAARRAAALTTPPDLETRDGREAVLLRDAREELGAHANDWIIRPNKRLDGVTPRSCARDSQTGLRTALRLLQARGREPSRPTTRNWS